MTDLRIVCTHDALKTAETLRRLLEAEEHKVVVSYGRQSMAELANVRASKQYVLLIWSYEAPTTQYILDWAAQIDASRLIEIARTGGFPMVTGHAPVIDFSNWNGERGGKAWNALSQRVRSIARENTPKKPPPKRAALGLAAVSLAAVAGAVFVRAHDVMHAQPQVAPEPDQITAQVDNPAPGDGVGGPLRAVEPLSEDYLYTVDPAPSMHFTNVSVTPLADLRVPELDPQTSLRAPTFFERLSDFNPLNRDSDQAPTPATKP
ncbi:MAG: hypothetical protein QM759_17450 [Terricaulis sp.]